MLKTFNGTRPGAPVHSMLFVRGDTIDLSIFDTAGLDETPEGTVRPLDAVDTLVKLFRNISGGVNLLVFVFKRGRALSKMAEYYKVFANDVGGEIWCDICHLQVYRLRKAGKM